MEFVFNLFGSILFVATSIFVVTQAIATVSIWGIDEVDGY